MAGATASPMTRFAGFELRTVAVIALASIGADVFRVTTVTLAGIFGVLAIVQGWTMWRHSRLVGVLPEGDEDQG